MLIDKISAGFSAEEDRILLDFCCGSEIYSYWLTRRAARIFADAINMLLKQQYDLLSAMAHAPAYAAEFEAFGREAAEESLPITKPCQQERCVSKGRPLLYSVSYQAVNKDCGALVLAAKDGNGLKFSMGRDALHALLSLLRSKCEYADWGLDLNVEIGSTISLMPATPKSIN